MAQEEAAAAEQVAAAAAHSEGLPLVETTLASTGGGSGRQPCLSPLQPALLPMQLLLPPPPCCRPRPRCPPCPAGCTLPCPACACPACRLLPARPLCLLCCLLPPPGAQLEAAAAHNESLVLFDKVLGVPDYREVVTDALDTALLSKFRVCKRLRSWIDPILAVRRVADADVAAEIHVTVFWRLVRIPHREIRLAKGEYDLHGFGIGLQIAKGASLIGQEGVVVMDDVRCTSRRACRSSAAAAQ